MGRKGREEKGSMTSKKSPSKSEAEAASNGPAFDQVRRFWQSPLVEQALISADIESSMAHVRMLGETNIVAPVLAQEVLHGLEKIRTEIADGKSLLSPEDRDIHASIYRRLFELVGRNADLMNMAISRNDQIATDIRLWLRDNLIDILSKVWELRQLLLKLAKRDLELVMPGNTHMQP